MGLQVGDTVIFTRTIWQGRIGTIKKIDIDGRITVDIPGTTCASRHEYSASALKKYEG